MNFYVSAFGASGEYTLDNVASIDLSFGTTSWIEPTVASRGTIRLHYPDGWVTPNPDLVLNSQIDVSADIYDPDTASFNTVLIWSGVVTDQTINYGIPYEGGTGWADELVLELGGYITEVNNQTVSLQTGVKPLDDYTTDLDTDYFITFFMPVDRDGRIDPASQQMAAFLDDVRFTYAGQLAEGSGYVSLLDNAQPYVLTVGFSDEDNDNTWRAYDTLDFKSAAEDYYTSITVSPQAVAAQTYATGEQPVIELTLSTISPTTAKALAAAQYYGNCLSYSGVFPRTVAIRAEAQAALIPTLSPSGWQDTVINALTTLKFRGEVIPVRIVGAELSATPETSYWRYHVTDALNGNFFILDDATNTLPGFNGFGALDENRLGF
jgi:hypothetical protein